MSTALTSKLRVMLIALAFLPAVHAWPAGEAAAQQMEDVVYLHDGSIYRGTITEQVPGESILIRTREGNVFRITMDRIARMTKEPAVGGAPTRQARAAEKSPGVAFLLSFLIPGVGQFYNGDYAKGGIQLGAAAIGAGLLAQTWEDCWEDDIDCGEWTAGAVLFFGSWIWSMIDAPISATRINRQAVGFALEIGPSVSVARSHNILQPVLRRGTLSKITSGPRLNIGVVRLRF